EADFQPEANRTGVTAATVRPSPDAALAGHEQADGLPRPEQHQTAEREPGQQQQVHGFPRTVVHAPCPASRHCRAEPKDMPPSLCIGGQREKRLSKEKLTTKTERHKEISFPSCLSVFVAGFSFFIRPSVL